MKTIGALLILLGGFLIGFAVRGMVTKPAPSQDAYYKNLQREYAEMLHRSQEQTNKLLILTENQSKTIDEQIEAIKVKNQAIEFCYGSGGELPKSYLERYGIK